jgi:hypothetical protein
MRSFTARSAGDYQRRGTSVRKIKFGVIGIGFGALGLLLALVHFWAGPFAPQPTLETTVAEAAVEIRDATVRALRGEEPAAKERVGWDIDKLTRVAIAMLGGLAIILAVFGLVNNEPKRQIAGAAALGISAVAFQFLGWFALALIVVILIAAVLQNLNFLDLG